MALAIVAPLVAVSCTDTDAVAPLAPETAAARADLPTIEGDGFTVTLLPRAPGVSVSVARAISADGRVVAGQAADQPVRWVDGEPELLPTLPQWEGSCQVAAVRGSGAVVGTCVHDFLTYFEEPVIWSPPGGIVTREVLPLPPSAHGGGATDVNARGDIAGYVYGVGPVIWRATGELDVLPHPEGATWRRVLGLAANGRAAGFAYLNAEGMRPLLWSVRGELEHVLAIPAGWDEGGASAVNARGEAAIVLRRWDGQPLEHPARWDGSTLTPLPLLPGIIQGSATGISPRGEIAGTLRGPYPTLPVPVLWQADGTILDLLAGIPFVGGEVLGIDATGRRLLGAVFMPSTAPEPVIWTLR